MSENEFADVNGRSSILSTLIDLSRNQQATFEFSAELQGPNWVDIFTQIVLHNNNKIHLHYSSGSKTLDADSNTAWTINDIIYHGSKR